MFEYLFKNLHLQFGVSQRYQCTGVPHVYLLVLQSHLDGSRQFQQAQVVGNGGTLLAYAFAEAFLRQSVLFQQVLVGKRYFHGVQVLALYVFDECHFHDILVVGRADIGGDARQPCHLRGAEAAFTGNNLVFIIGQLTQGDRLDDTNLCNRIGKLLQRCLVELAAGLIGVDGNLRQFYFIDRGRAFGLHLIHGEQGVQPTS